MQSSSGGLFLPFYALPCPRYPYSSVGLIPPCPPMPSLSVPPLSLVLLSLIRRAMAALPTCGHRPFILGPIPALAVLGVLPTSVRTFAL